MIITENSPLTLRKNMIPALLSSYIYIPYPEMSLKWHNNDTELTITVPWMTMNLTIDPLERKWLIQAEKNLHYYPNHKSVQRLLITLKDYPLSYIHPRPLSFFKDLNLKEGKRIEIDTSTPECFFKSLGLSTFSDLMNDLPRKWDWDWDIICQKANIPETDLYDPLSFISYLICYRLTWESNTWVGQDGLGQILNKALKVDEKKFFHLIGWITRQSWFITMESGKALEKAMISFPQARELLDHFIKDEAGHYKFMNQVFEDLELIKEDFSIGEATQWLIASHIHTAKISPLAFSAMINLFEAAYYEGEDPISRCIKQSSKPYASKGYDLHYKINQEHRHCDIPLMLGQYLAPQTRQHLNLTLAIFEVTLHFLDVMEQRLESFLK